MSLKMHLLAHDKDAWHLELHNIFFRLHLHFPVLQPLRQLQWICPWPPYKESIRTAFLTLISVLSGTSKIVNSFPWIFSIWFRLKSPLITPTQGRIQDFKLGGAHLKKLRRAEGGAKIFGVFRVKNHDFTQKNHIFSNFRGGRPPPLDPPLQLLHQFCIHLQFCLQWFL